MLRKEIEYLRVYLRYLCSQRHSYHWELHGNIDVEHLSAVSPLSYVSWSLYGKTLYLDFLSTVVSKIFGVMGSQLASQILKLMYKQSSSSLPCLNRLLILAHLAKK